MNVLVEALYVVVILALLLLLVCVLAFTVSYAGFRWEEWRERRQMKRMGIDPDDYHALLYAWTKHPAYRDFEARPGQEWRCTNCDRRFDDAVGENHPVTHMYRWHRTRGPEIEEL